jgi:hypothetical protein
MSNKEAKARGMEMIISNQWPEQFIAELSNAVYDAASVCFSCQLQSIKNSIFQKQEPWILHPEQDKW